jgi:hypothetical protein
MGVDLRAARFRCVVLVCQIPPQAVVLPHLDRLVICGAIRLVGRARRGRHLCPLQVRRSRSDTTMVHILA